MKLTDIKSNEQLLQYIEGLVNDFQGVEMQADIDDKTRKMYNDVLELGMFLVERQEKKEQRILKGLFKDAEEDFRKWDGTETTFGDSEHLASSVNYGIMAACKMLM